MEEKFVQQAVLQSAKAVEDAIDEEINRLDRMDEDELSSIRERRIKEMKEKAKKSSEWRALGHGRLQDMTDQKEFFEAVKKSDNVICHFYRKGNRYCDLVDEHLSNIAQQHLEARFVRLDAEKSPFLVEKLNIWMIPTVVLIKKGNTEHSIVGLDELGGSADFKTRDLEWLLSKWGLIEYDGPPPETGGEESEED